MGLIDTIMETCDHIIRHYERNENDILLKSGIACSIGAIITACFATHKSEKIIKEAKNDIEEIYEYQHFSDVEEKEVQKEVIEVGGKALLKVGLCFAVPIFLEAKSLHDFTKSNSNLKT